VLCCSAAGSAGQALPHAADNATHEQIGQASWYGPGFHGKKTASGKKFDKKALTAAHPTLPLGTRVEVTNLENDKKVDLEITDRGPHDGTRSIDLSEQAAHKLEMRTKGTARVKIKAITPASKKLQASKQEKASSASPSRQPGASSRIPQPFCLVPQKR
jgi:rare lipoprotein A